MVDPHFSSVRRRQLHAHVFSRLAVRAAKPDEGIAGLLPEPDVDVSPALIGDLDGEEVSYCWLSPSNSTRVDTTTPCEMKGATRIL